MPDRRFFRNHGPFSLAALAAAVEGDLAPCPNPDLRMEDVAPLQEATSSTISFLDNPAYVEHFAASKAGACVVAPKFADKAPEQMALILHEAPYAAYAQIAALFYPEAAGPSLAATREEEAPPPLVHPRAIVEETATLAPGWSIGPGAYIGPGVTIGQGTIIHANVTVTHATIGARAVLHPGVCIGQDGFGYAQQEGQHRKIPQLGCVVIEDDVEIGAGSTIDRGSGPNTIIGAGSKLDNLVQIGHNVRVGRGCILVAQVGIAGSTTIGDYTVIAGQAGIGGHLTIGSGVQIAAKSGVVRDVPDGERIGGIPAIPTKQYFRQVHAIAQLGKPKKNKEEA